MRGRELQRQQRLADRAFTGKQGRLAQRYPVTHGPQARRCRLGVPSGHVDEGERLIGIVGLVAAATMSRPRDPGAASARRCPGRTPAWRGWRLRRRRQPAGTRRRPANSRSADLVAADPTARAHRAQAERQRVELVVAAGIRRHAGQLVGAALQRRQRIFPLAAAIDRVEFVGATTMVAPRRWICVTVFGPTLRPHDRRRLGDEFSRYRFGEFRQIGTGHVAGFAAVPGVGLAGAGMGAQHHDLLAVCTAPRRGAAARSAR